MFRFRSLELVNQVREDRVAILDIRGRIIQYGIAVFQARGNTVPQRVVGCYGHVPCIALAATDVQCCTIFNALTAHIQCQLVRGCILQVEADRPY